MRSRESASRRNEVSSSRFLTMARSHWSLAAPPMRAIAERIAAFTVRESVLPYSVRRYAASSASPSGRSLRCGPAIGRVTLKATSRG